MHSRYKQQSGERVAKEEFSREANSAPSDVRTGLYACVCVCVEHVGAGHAWWPGKSYVTNAGALVVGDFWISGEWNVGTGLERLRYVRVARALAWQLGTLQLFDWSSA